MTIPKLEKLLLIFTVILVNRGNPTTLCLSVTIVSEMMKLPHDIVQSLKPHSFDITPKAVIIYV